MSPSPAGGTLYLIFIQVSSRALTFIGNQILLRYLSPTLLGIAVQLELLSVTVLYFARESLRVALQRQPELASSTEPDNEQANIKQSSQSTVNLSYLAITLGLIISLTSGPWYLRVADIEVLRSPDFTNAFLIYGLATVVELLAEPSFLIIQQHSLYSARARAETTAAIARCLFACATAIGLSSINYPPSVLPFAIGQLNYACALFVFYLFASRKSARKHIFHLRPVRLDGSDYLLSLFHLPTLNLAGTMYMQSVFKLLLTQGDALILSVLSSLADQGAFALAANYGSLLARLVFQPVEESSRNTFGRLLPSTSTAKPSPSNSKAALAYLSSLIHFYLLAALPLMLLIPPLVPVITPVLFSPTFHTPAIASLLSTYCYYIPFTAVNGILDSFVASVATPAQLRGQSLWMALFTALYGVASWILLSRMSLGAVGLVWANVVNMAFRILWSCWFMGSWFREHGVDKDSADTFWAGCMPSRGVVSAALGGAALQWAQSTGKSVRGEGGGLDTKKLTVWAVEVVLFAAAILLFERDFLISTLQTIVPERLASKIPFLKIVADKANAGVHKKET